jgi:hypothetical protein
MRNVLAPLTGIYLVSTWYLPVRPALPPTYVKNQPWSESDVTKFGVLPLDQEAQSLSHIHEAARQPEFRGKRVRPNFKILRPYS